MAVLVGWSRGSLARSLLKAHNGCKYAQSMSLLGGKGFGLFVSELILCEGGDLRILFSKPLTARTNDIPANFHQLCAEAELSARYERSRIHVVAIVKPMIVLLVMILRRRKNYDVIVTGRYGLLFALFQSLFPIWKKPHILLDMEFRSVPSDSTADIVKKYVKKFILRSVSRISVFCEKEIELYAEALGIERGRFFFLPYCSELPKDNGVFSEKEYIFSGGLHERDYASLIRATAGLGVDVYIASPINNLPVIDGRGDVYPLGVVSKSEYVRYISEAKIVVLCLKKTCLRYPGVITYVYAMSRGKCVIVNDKDGAASYIAHGLNGVLCEPGDIDSLRGEIVKALEDDEYRKFMGMNAKAYVEQNLTYKSYFDRINLVSQESMMKS